MCCTGVQSRILTCANQLAAGRSLESGVRFYSSRPRRFYEITNPRRRERLIGESYSKANQTFRPKKRNSQNHTGDSLQAAQSSPTAIGA